MRQIALATLLLCCATGCKCLPVPSSDSSPPSAGLIIEFEDTDGLVRSRTFSADDSDVTISASKDHVIAVLYIGSDTKGIRSIHLDYDMILVGTGTVTRPLVTAIYQTTGCPCSFLTGAHNFGGPGSQAWIYKFTARSENWVGLTTRSATITVKTQ